MIASRLASKRFKSLLRITKIAYISSAMLNVHTVYMASVVSAMSPQMYTKCAKIGNQTASCMANSTAIHNRFALLIRSLLDSIRPMMRHICLFNLSTLTESIAGNTTKTEFDLTISKSKWQLDFGVSSFYTATHIVYIWGEKNTTSVHTNRNAIIY